MISFSASKILDFSFSPYNLPIDSCHSYIVTTNSMVCVV